MTSQITWDDSCKAIFGLPIGAEVNYEVFLSTVRSEERDRVNQQVEAAIAKGSPGVPGCRVSGNPNRGSSGTLDCVTRKSDF